MRNLIQKKQLTDWQTDSAGLRDWNMGLPAEGRAQHLLRQHGLKTNHLRRKVAAPNSFYGICSHT